MRRFMAKTAHPSEKQSQGAFNKRILIKVCTLSVLFFVIGSMMHVNSAWALTTNITINTGKTLTTNQFSLGFTMGNEWKTWSSSSTQQQLTKDGNFKMIHIYSWLVEPCTRWYEASATGSFNWASVDSLMQKIFAVGAQPVISLGYGDSKGIKVPSGMAVNPATGLPYPNSFAAYCRAWVTHMQTKGFAVRYYEVVNEAWYYFYPNWNAWSSVKAGYFLQLFNACYDAMHAQNSQVLVGNDASLHRKFLDYWLANGGKLDFLSFHNYDCDGTSMADQTPLQRAEQRFYVTDSYFYGVKDARQKWFNARGNTLPAIATEANWAATSSSGTDPRIQKVVGAVWTALMLKSSILNNVQSQTYFCFSSSKSWELSHKTSGGYGFGMVNQDNNQPWYPYYVQKLIGTNLAVGDLIVDSTSSSSSISTLAWVHGGKLNLLLVSKIDQATDVSLSGLTGTLNYFKIDNTISYQNPQVQTGTIGATSLLSFKGYTVILLQSGASTPPPPPSTILSDGFESSNFGSWNGIVTTSLETANVVGTMTHTGTHSARFVSNGNGGFEKAYSYKNVASLTEVYARGYFYVDASGIRSNGNSIYLITLSASSNNLAYVGWTMTGGALKWNLLTRNGVNYVNVYSASSPALDRWYCVELHWVQSNTNGYGELYVNGVLVCSISNRNTAAFGSSNIACFGLPELYNCGATTVYSDDCVISTKYIGQ